MYIHFSKTWSPPKNGSVTPIGVKNNRLKTTVPENQHLTRQRILMVFVWLQLIVVCQRQWSRFTVHFVSLKILYSFNFDYFFDDFLFDEAVPTTMTERNHRMTNIHDWCAYNRILCYANEKHLSLHLIISKISIISKKNYVFVNVWKPLSSTLCSCSWKISDRTQFLTVGISPLGGSALSVCRVGQRYRETTLHRLFCPGARTMEAGVVCWSSALLLNNVYFDRNCFYKGVLSLVSLNAAYL